MKTKKSEKWASTKVKVFTLFFSALDSEGGIGGSKLAVEKRVFVVYVDVYFHPQSGHWAAYCTSACIYTIHLTTPMKNRPYTWTHSSSSSSSSSSNTGER